jgi:hypothetical protein
MGAETFPLDKAPGMTGTTQKGYKEGQKNAEDLCAVPS